MKLSFLIGFAVFALDPSYGCRKDTFHYGEAEMRAAVEGTWRLSMPESYDAPARTYTFRITAATASQHGERSFGIPFISSAHACGDRTLVRSASACEPRSLMPLELANIAGDGRLEVDGYLFDTARLELHVDNRDIIARIDNHGVVNDVTDGAELVRVFL